MHVSPFKFFLTGSRFFTGRYQTSSDHDYFTEYSEDVMLFLSNIGFKIHSDTTYNDSETQVVMRGYFPFTGWIDIQLVNDAKLKNKIQDMLKKNDILKPTTEQWDMAFKFAKMFAA